MGYFTCSGDWSLLSLPQCSLGGCVLPSLGSLFMQSIPGRKPREAQRAKEALLWFWNCLGIRDWKQSMRMKVNREARQKAKVLCNVITFCFILDWPPLLTAHILLTRSWRVKTQLINVDFPTCKTIAHKSSSVPLILLSVFLETASESREGKNWSFFLSLSSCWVACS